MFLSAHSGPFMTLGDHEHPLKTEARRRQPWDGIKRSIYSGKSANMRW